MRGLNGQFTGGTMRSFRFDGATISNLRKIAAEWGVTESEALRRAVFLAAGSGAEPPALTGMRGAGLRRRRKP